MRQVHFLHIGKCAGTSIKSLAQKINSSGKGVQITAHPHWVGLSNLPAGSQYFFSIRNPETRFVSGFYSRKRKGQPRYYSEWSPHERLAFGKFEHANDLAEALFADGELGADAFSAMKSIEHLALDQSDYFRSWGFFLTHRPPLAVIRQEHYDADIELLLRRLNIEGLPLADVRAAEHRNDYSGTKPLSEKALANLRRWYVQDHDLYRHCSRWIAQTAGG